MEKPIEDYDTSLTDVQKNLLDDAPAKVIKHLFDRVEEAGMPAFFNLRKTDKLTGDTEFVEFIGIDAVNGIDYLKYLVRNGYKDLADAG